MYFMFFNRGFFRTQDPLDEILKTCTCHRYYQICNPEKYQDNEDIFDGGMTFPNYDFKLNI